MMSMLTALLVLVGSLLTSHPVTVSAFANMDTVRIHNNRNEVSRYLHREALVNVVKRKPPKTIVHHSIITNSIWDRLVQCEAHGDWQYGAPGHPIDPGYFFEGGPNFTHETWTAYKLPGMPSHAYYATKSQQILVAKRVLADQGPNAWPVCSKVVGLTRENGLSQ